MSNGRVHHRQDCIYAPWISIRGRRQASGNEMFCFCLSGKMAGIAYIFTTVGCNSGICERAMKLACGYLGGYLTTVKSRGSLLEAARPTFFCCDACARVLEGKLAQGDVSNDLLRKFDGTRFGALFRTKVVCNWTLLPLGFHGSLALTSCCKSNRLEVV